MWSSREQSVLTVAEVARITEQLATQLALDFDFIVTIIPVDVRRRVAIHPTIVPDVAAHKLATEILSRTPIDQQLKFFSALRKQFPGIEIFATAESKLGEHLARSAPASENGLNPKGLISDTEGTSSATTGQLIVVGAELADPSIQSLPVAAWPRMLALDASYSARRDRLVASMMNGEYDEAVAEYWPLIYYTGTRELWVDNAYLSQRLIELSAQQGDKKTVGLLQARGEAWPLMRKGLFGQAKGVLHDALKSLVAANAQAEIGVFYEYMADMAAASGDFETATSYYSEAVRRLPDSDAHKVELKRRFVHARYYAGSPAKQEKELTDIMGAYGALKTYREGIVQMELAIACYARKAPEAIVLAESAFRLLHADVRMPSKDAHARRLVGRIRRGQRIDPLLSDWSKVAHV